MTFQVIVSFHKPFCRIWLHDIFRKETRPKTCSWVSKAGFFSNLCILAYANKRICCFLILPWSSLFGNNRLGLESKENKNLKYLNFYKCKGVNFTIGLIFDLKKLSSLLKLTNGTKLKISTKIHSTEAQTLGIFWLNICSSWKRLIPLNKHWYRGWWLCVWLLGRRTMR